jgi:hypothetical protein
MPPREAGPPNSRADCPSRPAARHVHRNLRQVNTEARAVVRRTDRPSPRTMRPYRLRAPKEVSPPVPGALRAQFRNQHHQGGHTGRRRAPVTHNHTRPKRVRKVSSTVLRGGGAAEAGEVVVGSGDPPAVGPAVDLLLAPVPLAGSALLLRPLHEEQVRVHVASDRRGALSEAAVALPQQARADLQRDLGGGRERWCHRRRHAAARPAAGRGRRPCRRRRARAAAAAAAARPLARARELRHHTAAGARPCQLSQAGTRGGAWVPR